MDHVRRVDLERATDAEHQTRVQAKGAREPDNGDASLGEPGAKKIKDLVHDERDAQLRAPAEPQRDLNSLALGAPGSEAIKEKADVEGRHDEGYGRPAATLA